MSETKLSIYTHGTSSQFKTVFNGSVVVGQFNMFIQSEVDQLNKLTGTNFKKLTDWNDLKVK